METRRVFLFNLAANLVTFATGGSLVIAGKEEAQEVVKNYNQEKTSHPEQESENLAIVPKKYTDRVGFPIITVNHATDFALGGVVGIALKKVIEQSIKLNQTNKTLSSTASKLQQLKYNDLPKIEKILKEFIEKEGIKYEVNKDSNPTESILSLLNTILIHVDSQKKAVQPFLEELQKFREAFTGPFTKQLQNGGDIDKATQEFVIGVLRGEKLTKHVEAIVINALDSDGAGKRMGKKFVDSLTKKDLVSDDAVTALRQSVVDVIRSSLFITAFTEATSTAVTEYGMAYELVSFMVEEFKNSKIPDDTPGLVVLRNAFNTALERALTKEDVANNLDKIVYNVTSESDIGEIFTENLQKILNTKQLLKPQ